MEYPGRRFHAFHTEQSVRFFAGSYSYSCEGDGYGNPVLFTPGFDFQAAGFTVLDQLEPFLIGTVIHRLQRKL